MTLVLVLAVAAMAAGLIVLAVVGWFIRDWYLDAKECRAYESRHAARRDPDDDAAYFRKIAQPEVAHEEFMPAPPVILRAAKTLTEAELDVIRQRFLAAQGGLPEPQWHEPQHAAPLEGTVLHPGAPGTSLAWPDAAMLASEFPEWWSESGIMRAITAADIAAIEQGGS